MGWDEMSCVCADSESKGADVSIHALARRRHGGDDLRFGLGTVGGGDQGGSARAADEKVRVCGLCLCLCLCFCGTRYSMLVGMKMEVLAAFHCPAATTDGRSGSV